VFVSGTSLRVVALDCVDGGCSDCVDGGCSDWFGQSMGSFGSVGGVLWVRVGLCVGLGCKGSRSEVSVTFVVCMRGWVLRTLGWSSEVIVVCEAVTVAVVPDTIR
jgi:hypothetical protein